MDRSQKQELGVIEGFFGPVWDRRLELAPFLRKYGFSTYLYAPKADKQLRRQWTKPWSPEYVNFLRELSQEFRSRGIKFGVGLSPYGINEMAPDLVEKLLREKVESLNAIGIDELGFFFDDMKVHGGLAQAQIKALAIVQKATSVRILFCPSFYTPDPILDKVFGERPAGYLEDLARALPPSVEIGWTGPKVISNDITADHLKETARLLKRKPFIWDNLFANDGPKNCKFLRFRPGGVRAFDEASGWLVNPMNQMELSKIALLSLRLGWDAAIDELCSPGLALYIKKYMNLFTNEGLDKISPSLQGQLLTELKWQEPAATDIRNWLQGKYIVGSECLTD